MSNQQKALLLDKPAGKLTVGLIDIPGPLPGFVVVEVRAAALNPLDWIMRDTGMFVDQWPAILGNDAAGVVTAVGEGVTNLAVGDRVLHAGSLTEPRMSTFRQYTVIRAEFAAKVPENVSFDEAATIPSTLATAVLGMYGPKRRPNGGIALTPPWEEGGRGKYAGEPFIVVGGASCVGQFVIQFAKLSGFSPIIATASVHNEEYLKSVGATHVIDRNIPADELAAAVKEITDKDVKYAYDAVADATMQSVVYNLLASGGQLVNVRPAPLDSVKETEDKYIAHVLAGVQRPWNAEVGRGLFASLEKYMKDGDVKPTRVELLQGGLAGIAEGLDKLKKGVSAVKLVARPQDTL
ncbi:zinc-binding alcohol dehydrogenase family protein [Phanerochaete sordida]|uniref:Zinc-binding alcohol dehydrogenase family protein n=1 Tax=Phanerochaete sordida TaxID=48140 RepID=A0A9P3G644_9APHY|nr:zinc-binding alcohol dehydrogenase family protein [Phanerochaete sordida]